jgi:hypothetical protein
MSAMGDPTLFPVAPEVKSSAIIIGEYRYELRRCWGSALPNHQVGFVMLNPSTADADQDDPTIRRCVAFAKAWGYGGIVVRNLYALRATDPAELWTHPDPIGSHNHTFLANCLTDALTVCAWGAHGARNNRARDFSSWFREFGRPLYHLGLTAAGQPRHPLYLKATTRPIRWETPA